MPAGSALAVNPQTGSGYLLSLTPDLRADLLRRISEGASARAAALASGIPERSWSGWMEAARTGLWADGTHAAPATLLALRALADEIARLEAENEARCQRTMLGAGERRVGEVDWRAHHEYLKHADATRARWHEYREVHVTQSGRVDVHHQRAERMTDAELAEALPAEYRELFTIRDGSDAGAPQ